MKRLDDVGTRRQVFRAVAAGAASIPLLSCNDSAGTSGNSSGGWGSGGSGRGGSGWGSGSGGSSGGCCCLLKGTSVFAPKGERLIEDLRIGDEIVTLSGPKAIKWIGYNKYTKDDDRRWQDGVMPIRVARLAIDDVAPHSDLYLSPQHCVFINETLIPVKYLVNGTSIAPAAPSGMTAVEYYHVEFDTHEVFYAEGAPVESFMEEDSEREYFLNFVQYERLYGREHQPRMTPFAPILRYGNRHQKLVGFARSWISSVIDVRDPIQAARDGLARRAEAMPV
jgi:Hint domain